MSHASDPEPKRGPLTEQALKRTLLAFFGGLALIAVLIFLGLKL